nr:hypothetical protein [Pseudomonadales bacterium]
MIDMPELTDARLRLDDAGVATLTLARDDVRNALTGTGLIADIVNTCDWINRNRAVGALVLTGYGWAFSSGGNINGMRDTRGGLAPEWAPRGAHFFGSRKGCAVLARGLLLHRESGRRRKIGATAAWRYRQQPHPWARESAWRPWRKSPRGSRSWWW